LDHHIPSYPHFQLCTGQWKQYTECHDATLQAQHYGTGAMNAVFLKKVAEFRQGKSEINQHEIRIRQGKFGIHHLKK